MDVNKNSMQCESVWDIKSRRDPSPCDAVMRQMLVFCKFWRLWKVHYESWKCNIVLWTGDEKKKIMVHFFKNKKKGRVRWTSTFADLHTLKTTNHNFPSFHTIPSLPPINKQSSNLRKFGGCTLATGGEIILVTKWKNTVIHIWQEMFLEHSQSSYW